MKRLSSCLKLRLGFLGAMLVASFAAGPGGATLFGGIPALGYLFVVRTWVGSAVGGLGLVAATIPTELYVASRSESSTAPLGYLWLPIVLLSGLALLLLVEAIVPGPEGRRTAALVVATIAALLGYLLVCDFFGGIWCWLSIAILAACAALSTIRLVRRRTSPSQGPVSPPTPSRPRG
jgi:hypothetical protein